MKNAKSLRILVDWCRHSCFNYTGGGCFMSVLDIFLVVFRQKYHFLPRLGLPGMLVLHQKLVMIFNCSNTQNIDQRLQWSSQTTKFCKSGSKFANSDQQQLENLFSSDIEISARLNFRRPPSTVDVVDDALIAPREWTVEGRMLWSWSLGNCPRRLSLVYSSITLLLLPTRAVIVCPKLETWLFSHDDGFPTKNIFDEFCADPSVACNVSFQSIFQKYF